MERPDRIDEQGFGKKQSLQWESKPASPRYGVCFTKPVAFQLRSRKSDGPRASRNHSQKARRTTELDAEEHGHRTCSRRVVDVAGLKSVSVARPGVPRSWVKTAQQVPKVLLYTRPCCSLRVLSLRHLQLEVERIQTHKVLMRV